ncbi:hypothetical protein GCM10009574_089900 [Streptomyces asiaticus]|uniref:Uncharacterized protein n=2 Tax=Streptomyces rhizosphaericus TaxID=114699 RepID=A0ABN1SK14_9ACTN|nr:hypothetical protein [Streptomyces rhizosphaericus]
MLADALSHEAGGQTEYGRRHRKPLGLVGVQEGLVAAVEHGGQLPADIDGVLDTGVHALAVGGGVDVCGVPGEEDPAHAVVVDHADVQSPAGEPGGLAQPHRVRPDQRVHDALEGLEGRFAGVAGGDGRLDLEGVGGRQRAQRDRTALGALPDVPVVAVQAVQPDIAEQHPLVLVGLAEERDIQKAPDRPGAAVGADHIAGRGTRTVGEHRLDMSGVPHQIGDRSVPLHR